jgi:hypothetical protein
MFNIVIYLSDEYGINKIWFNKVDLIFRTYPRKGFCDNKKIFPIPCGLVMPDFVKYQMEQPKKKLSERRYDFFYSGQLAPNRESFLSKIASITKNFNGILRNTASFRTGYSIDEYFQIMNESRISFVPLGKVIPESFRYMESFESGCVVITDFPIGEYKHLWYYKESPAIFTTNMAYPISEAFIKDILDNIDTYYERNLKYYEDFLSTNAVAGYINHITKQKIVYNFENKDIIK